MKKNYTYYVLPLICIALFATTTFNAYSKSNSNIGFNNLINEYQSIFVKVLIDEALETQLAGLETPLEASNASFRVITYCPDNFSVNVDPGTCGAVVTFPLPTTDTLGYSMVPISVLADGDIFPVGTTTVTYQEQEIAGLGIGDTCDFDVTVFDNEAPALVGVPADDTAQCDAIPAVAAVTATDNCDTTLTVGFTETNNVTDGVGSIIREWTVTDDAGSTTTETQTITVIDSTGPTPSLGSLPDITAECSVTSLTAPTATDNCSGSVTVSNNVTLPISGEGTTTVVTWTYDDGNGNTSTQTQNVIIDDITNPTITCPPNVTVNANASCVATGVALGTPTTADNCGVASVTNNAPAAFPLGNTTVTWTVRDNSGRTATCTQTVTVNDTTAPSISCPSNQNVTFNAACGFVLQDYTSLATTTDNCVGTITVTQSPAPGAVIAGAVAVTLTATDQAGNFSTCTFQVIPTDNIPPVAVCRDYTAVLSPTGTVNIAAINIDNGSSDNCGVANMTVSPNSFNCANVGANTVTFTVYDNAGNSDSCTATITVVDNTPPTMICRNYVVVIDAITRVATILPSDVNNGSNDICGLASLTVSPDTFPEAASVYTTTTTLTATDVNGNISTCTANVTVEPPVNQFTFLTGVIVNPIPDNPQPPSALIEATSCPGGTTTPRDVEFNLQPIGTYPLQASDVNFWEISNDNGETWTPIPGTTGLLTYTILGLTTDTFVRLNITDYTDPANPVTKSSAEAYVRFLPPDEPPVVVSQSATDICLNESVTIVAESFFDQPNGQFGEGGEFNYAQPDGWRVDGIDGEFPASGNTTTIPTWKETNSNNIRTFSGINYDTTDNSKFAIANGVGNVTTLETPVFSTIGMTASEAIMSFNTSYYFCNGGNGIIELSFDSGNTYTVQLNVAGHTFSSGTTTGVIMGRVQGNCVGVTDPRMVNASINLGAYTGLSGLRVRFTFTGSSTTCQNVAFPNPNGENCNGANSTVNVASGWAIDAVGFAYAQVDDELEWTDENGTIVAYGTTVVVTPITPGIREYGVTALINGCRADNDDGTNFVNINTSLAYAGQDYAPLNNECGESALQLNAYDNTRTAVENYNKGAWINNLYVVPDINAGDTNYVGTGITGSWSVANSTNVSCGSGGVFSSNTDPDAVFTGAPGDYTLRWTLSNGCFDDVNVRITSCATVDFDGLNDNVTFRNNYNLNSPFTIETWVKPNSVSGSQTVFSKKDDTNDTNGYALSIVNGQVVFNWYNNSGVGSVTSGVHNIGTNRWYHLAVSFNGSQYILYVDGLEMNIVNGSAPNSTPGNIDALLGAMDQAPPITSPTKFYNGWIDELRIWNKELDVQHIRQMMNQRIETSGTDVIGVEIPIKIYGADINQDGIEDNPLLWSNLIGYYRMSSSCGDLAAYKGVTGRLRNITTSQQQTAPLPYTSRANQAWDNVNTWLNSTVWDVPNSPGINGLPIEWNIVRTSHNIISDNRDLTLLGLMVNNNELTISGTGPQDETNNGTGLLVTHYLKINGKIDLVGESQLVQKRLNASQFSESFFDSTSGGSLERDQQGTGNPFNYNYWGSPVSPGNASVTTANVSTNTYSIGSILFDGSVSRPDPINFPISWTGNNTAASTPTATQISTRWIYTYANNPGNTYSEWDFVSNSASFNIGLGYTMKGSGIDPVAPFNGTQQNYVFVGKPNNGTIRNTISSGSDALVGNPYPSAIDARKFIKDNLPSLNPDGSPSPANVGTSQSIDGTLYFWEHFLNSATHLVAGYIGGYAYLNLIGGVEASTPPPTTDGVVIIGGTGTRRPEFYVPVGQGFFVSASDTGGNIVFKNSQRDFRREVVTGGDGSLFFRTSNSMADADTDTEDALMQKVRLKFESPEGSERALLLGFEPNNLATDGVDYGYDALNYDNYPSDLLWLIDGQGYVIQGVGAFDVTKQYPLTMNLAIAGNIKISLTDLENFDPEIDVFIYDSLLETYTNFNTNSFEMTLEANNYPNRFYLTFSPNGQLSIEENDLTSVDIFYANDIESLVLVNPTLRDIDKIELFNIIGQPVHLINNVSNTNYEEFKVGNLSSGTYIIKLTTPSGTSSKKVLVK